MKYVLALFVSLVVFVGCNCTGLSVNLTRSVKTIYQESSPSVFLVKTSAGHCSGFLITKDTIVTAGHCVENTDNIVFIFDKYGNEYLAIPYIDDDEKDVALMMVLSHEIDDRFVPLSLGEVPVIGERLITIGFPGYSGGLQVLEVSHLKQIRNYSNRKLLISDGIAYPGESGSPVFDERGFVIGVAVGIKPVAGAHKDESILVSILDLKEILGVDRD